MNNIKNNELESSIDYYIQAVYQRKATDIVVLNIHELTTIADVLIICSGKSSRQVNAISEYVRDYLKKNHKIKPIGIEGLEEGSWVLLDYGHVIIHIFHEPIRSLYDIEGLWIDAKKIGTEELLGVSS